LGNIKKIQLKELGEGLNYLTPSYGMVLAEAAAVCLDNQGHPNGVELLVDGDFSDKFHIYWPVVDQSMRRCYADLVEATENGAYGIAILLAKDLAGFKIIEKSVRGNGFDYWLGFTDDFIFQNKTRLEVSGILNGEERDIQSRLRIKIGQTKKSDKLNIPAYIIIVEYGNPISRIKIR